MICPKNAVSFLSFRKEFLKEKVSNLFSDKVKGILNCVCVFVHMHIMCMGREEVGKDSMNL